MIIAITGSNSGLGQALANALDNHKIIQMSRVSLDLSNILSVQNYEFEFCDMLINCAATDIGGKTNFLEHAIDYISEIINVNLLSPIILSHKALNKNQNCKIVNITSTNNNRYYANNLAYSLSKLGLADFGKLLKVDLPSCKLLEIRLGLTKTNFNNSRYRDQPERFEDIYTLPHLDVNIAAEKIVNVLFDDSIKFLEVAP